MNRYRLWIRLPNMPDAFLFVHALNHFQALALAEAQYGVGNVLNVCSWPED